MNKERKELKNSLPLNTKRRKLVFTTKLFVGAINVKFILFFPCKLFRIKENYENLNNFKRMKATRKVI